MSNAALSWALRTRVGSSSAKAVLLLLAERANEAENECYPGTASIADDTELAVRTVKDALALLEDLGAITRRARYKGYGKRTSDLYKIMIDRTILVDKPKQKPRGRAVRDAVTTAVESLGANSAPNEELTHLASLGANSAPNGAEVETQEKGQVTPLGANSAPKAKLPSPEQSLGANSASSGAEFAPALMDESPELIPRSSSSVPEVTTEPPNDTADEADATTGDPSAGSWIVDDDFSPPNEAIQNALTGFDTRLSLSALTRELVKLHVDQTDVNIVAAAAEIWSRLEAGKRLSDPAAYLASCIARTPEAWSRQARVPPRHPPGDLCKELGHKWQQDYPFCLRCEAEQPNWRDQRDSKLLVIGEAR